MKEEMREQEDTRSVVIISLVFLSRSLIFFLPFYIGTIETYCVVVTRNCTTFFSFFSFFFNIILVRERLQSTRGERR